MNAEMEGWKADLVEWQHGKCGGCERPFTPTRRPALDHHHASGKVRGALCDFCNGLLGVVHENAAMLRGLADYLEHNPADDCWPGERKWWPGSPGAAGLETT